jgi:hypothetical protein
MQKVTVLNDDGTNDAIKGNVKPGDRVITDGAMNVIQGSKVNAKKAVAGKPQQSQQAPAGAQ